MKIVEEIENSSCGRIWKFQLHMVLCTVIFASFDRSPKKWQPVWLGYIVQSLDEADENWERRRVLKKLQNWKFCKVHCMTSNQTQGIRHQKYPTYVHYSTPSPKFSSVSLYDYPFLRYRHLRLSPLTPMLKFQSATKFLKLGRLPRKVTACIPPWQLMSS